MRERGEREIKITWIKILFFISLHSIESNLKIVSFKIPSIHPSIHSSLRDIKKYLTSSYSHRVMFVLWCTPVCTLILIKYRKRNDRKTQRELNRKIICRKIISLSESAKIHLIYLQTNCIIKIVQLSLGHSLSTFIFVLVVITQHPDIEVEEI